MRTVTFVVLLAALGARRVGAQVTTTTVVVTTTTTSTTTTTLPPTPPGALCTCNASNVCEVKKGTYRVNPGSDLNFGSCALTLDTGATVALTSGAGAGFTIEAASLTMNAGSTIQGAPTALAPDDGGFVGISVTGAILVDAGARISMDAQDAGGSEIDLTAGGTIMLEGGAGTDVVSAKALSTNGDGGTLNVTANGDVTIDATLSAASGDQGSGGDICITTNNAKVTVNAPLDASGGEFDGGCIDIESDLDLMTTAAAKLSVDGGGLSGSGGQITLDANVQGPVTINGPVSGKAAGSNQNNGEGGGDGGELDSFTTSGSVTVNAPVDLPGGTGGGGGGFIDIEPLGGDLVVNAALSLPGSGSGSCGGTATLGVTGTSNVTLSSNPIDVSSDSCGGGTVLLSADDTAIAPGVINADSNATPVGGGLIQLVADILTVGGKLHANGGGGEVNLQACALTLGATGQAVTMGTNGFNLLQASGPMEVDGTMTAALANTLDYLDPAHLPVVNSHSVSPPATIVDDNPPVTPLCPGQTTTTSTTSTSTTITATTSTTIRTTTTTVRTTTTLGVTTTSTSTTQATVTSTSTTTSARSSTSTTSIVAPTTSSTVVSTTSSTIVAASTTTTVMAPQSTTTTIPAPPCSGEPTAMDAASCGIQTLTNTVETTAPAALGGSRTAHRLEALLRQANHALDSVEHGTKVKANLGKTRRALNRFEALMRIGLKRKRGAIDPQVGQIILGLATNATTSIGEMEVKVH
jgi:hypothetical protein